MESPSPRRRKNHSNYLAMQKGKPIFDAQNLTYDGNHVKYQEMNLHDVWSSADKEYRVQASMTDNNMGLPPSV